jgi:hypothetical protein
VTSLRKSDAQLDASRALARAMAVSGYADPDPVEQWRLPDVQRILDELATDGFAVTRIWPEPALRKAVLFGPPVDFPNLPAQPTGPDLLDAIAHWMDAVDAKSGNDNHEVQEHLKDWANRLRAALREGAA